MPLIDDMTSHDIAFFAVMLAVIAVLFIVSVVFVVMYVRECQRLPCEDDRDEEEI